MERKKVMQAETKMKKIFVLGFALVLGSFVACDDGSSANHNDEDLDGSSSSVILSGGSATDRGSSGSAKSSDSNGAKSSSSVKQEGTSAESNGSSDASGKSSSSGKEKSSDSNSSSSSEWKFTDDPCSEDEEGWSTEIDNVEYECIGGRWVAQPSSSSAARSSSSYYDMTEQFADGYSYGLFEDPRDKQVYKTARYANGYFGVDSITIFAQNLNFGKKVAGGSEQKDSTKYCYNDDSWYCENGFGGLYTWSTAMNFPRACDSVAISDPKCNRSFNYSHDNGLPHDARLPETDDYVQHQGICPAGWHVMNFSEWAVLMEMISDNSSANYYFGSKVSYGTNKYGLSLLIGGFYKEEYQGIQSLTDFWRPEQYPDEPSIARVVRITKNSFESSVSGANKVSGIYVRCVKDY